MMLWKSSAPDGTNGSPLGLREDEVALLQVLREDDPDPAADPLLDHVRALRAPRLVPAERPDDGLDLIRVQPVDELLLALALLGAAGGLDRGGDHLARRVRVRLVLRRRLAELLLVALDELLVAGERRLRRVTGGREDALGV